MPHPILHAFKSDSLILPNISHKNFVCSKSHEGEVTTYPLHPKIIITNSQLNAAGPFYHVTLKDETPERISNDPKPVLDVVYRANTTIPASSAKHLGLIRSVTNPDEKFLVINPKATVIKNVKPDWVEMNKICPKGPVNHFYKLKVEATDALGIRKAGVPVGKALLSAKGLPESVNKLKFF